MIALLTDPSSNRVKRQAERWVRFEWNDAFVLGAFVVSVVMALFVIIGVVAQVMFHPKHPWPAQAYVLLSIVPSLFIIVVLIVAYGFRRSINLAGNEYELDAIREGVLAYWAMEPVLRKEAFPVYRNLYTTMKRWKIAEEKSALVEAVQRGRMLRQIHDEGKLTRATHIDISDKKDLDHGREIMRALAAVREEIDTSRKALTAGTHVESESDGEEPSISKATKIRPVVNGFSDKDKRVWPPEKAGYPRA